MSKISPTKQKILLALLAGLAMSLTHRPDHPYKIVKSLIKGWKEIDREKLKKEIKELYQSKLVGLKENPDKSFTMVLTDKGKLKVLKYHFQNLKIPKQDWDKKWRIVVFDIPEKFKKERDALRRRLQALGFYEFQKSVFVFPYESKDEINFLIEFFNLRKYVRCGVLEFIDNDLHLRKIFKLV